MIGAGNGGPSAALAVRYWPGDLLEEAAEAGDVRAQCELWDRQANHGAGPKREDEG